VKSRPKLELGLTGKVCDPQRVAATSSELGLDGAEMVQTVTTPKVPVAAVDALLSTYSDEVFGVPFSVIGTARYWGVERLDAFACYIGISPARRFQCSGSRRIRYKGRRRSRLFVISRNQCRRWLRS
jgi:hypothetical protein